ncbi:hypothetical protein [Methylomonas methanica]|uniref:Uncharacterized protein n=1 Tax=Methylomonas methanica (strain DSM 25384 / MC09) TaxID=857087 RepID=G0A130_METMM|nr:hypothetical protein [Methylomonas methanica]AEG01286.1 hypothetical protein Metme_2906 [Methylomonas methanica MC09]
MKSRNSFFRDILTGLLFTTGIFGFMSGEFVLSTVLFGAASLSSNLDLGRNVEL